MSYQKSATNEQVGFNLLAQRTFLLANLGSRASNSFLSGRVDDYYYACVALRQNLTPNLNPAEVKVLTRIENRINFYKMKSVEQQKEETRDEPGYIIMSNFKKINRKQNRKNLTALYVDNIKKYEQALYIIMKKKGFYPGKQDATSMT